MAYDDVAILRPTLIDIDVVEFFDATVLGERQIFGIERVTVDMNVVAYTDPMAIFIRTNLTDIVHISDNLLSPYWIAVSRAVSRIQNVTVTESITMQVV